MTLKPPNPNIEPRFGEDLSPARLREIFAQIQQNQDFLCQQFPLQVGAIGSLFLQGVVRTHELESAALAWGQVSNAGARVIGSPGWTASRPEAGVYDVVFNESFASGPAVLGVDAQGTQRTFSYSVIAANWFRAVMSNGTGSKENIGFTFVAIG